MRLRGPDLVRGDGTPINDNRPNKLKKYLIWLIIILVLAGGALLYWHHHQKNKIYTTNPSPISQNISLLSNSQDLGNKRVVISSYLQQNNYNKAAQLAQDLAKSTNLTEDYINVVRICAGYSVNDKSDCLNNVLSVLEARLNKVSFFDAYTIGDMLDGVGRNKDQAKFYQRAYDTYDPTRSQGLMTKDQLKAKIDALK